MPLRTSSTARMVTRHSRSVEVRDSRSHPHKHKDTSTPTASARHSDTLYLSLSPPARDQSPDTTLVCDSPTRRWFRQTHAACCPCTARRRVIAALSGEPRRIHALKPNHQYKHKDTLLTHRPQARRHQETSTGPENRGLPPHCTHSGGERTLFRRKVPRLPWPVLLGLRRGKVLLLVVVQLLRLSRSDANHETGPEDVLFPRVRGRRRSRTPHRHRPVCATHPRVSCLRSARTHRGPAIHNTKAYTPAQCPPVCGSPKPQAHPTGAPSL